MKNAEPQNTQAQYYSLPLLLAVSLHIVILAFLMFELSFPTKSSPGASSSTPVIQAVAVSQQTLDNYENQVQAAREAVIKQQQLQQQIAREKIIYQQELVRQQQLKQLQAQRQAEEMAKQKIMAAQKAAAQAAAEKAAAQKAAVEKAQKRAEQKAEKKLLQKALAQDMQKELASDQHELNQSDQHAAASSKSSSSPAPQNQGMIDKYKALIVQAISSQWIVPSNLPQNISCELDIRIAPGGAVLQVSVARSSGNPVLDNSAVAAVNKASPLPVPTEPGVFSQFRELHLTVKPDGSMTEA